MKKIVAILISATAFMATSAFGNCEWNGTWYAEGTRSTDNRYVCSGGEWIPLQVPAPAPAPNPAPTSCVETDVRGDYLCKNGNWINMAGCYLNLLPFACRIDEAAGNCHWVNGVGCRVGPAK